MALSIPERIAQVAEHIAEHDSHGYSQPRREGNGATETITLSDGSKVTVHGGDYDCSEMVRVCVNCALSGRHAGPIDWMWTGDEDEKLKAQGFARTAYSASKVKRGDVLWVSGHTGIALGDGMQADAHGDEVGGITGPSQGDQTGTEIEARPLRSWTYIYRHAGSDSGTAPFVACTFRFKAPGYNVRSAPDFDADVTGQLDDDTIVADGISTGEGRIWATYVANSGKRRYVSLARLNDGVEVA